ncbi:hypothetical protein DFH06DRAFT_1364956 [Mycena polygramma]|nr:hypothetical protein DFH06DRAFT_1364956 [Mycena polygramma]
MPTATATPALHIFVQTAIRKAMKTSTTPIDAFLAEHGLRNHLEAATDLVLERYDKLGQLALNMCFIIQDGVLAGATLAHVMQHADVNIPTTNPRVLTEALQIFIGALFRKTDLDTVLSWFRPVFLPIIATANDAYATWHSRNKITLEVMQPEPAAANSKEGATETAKKFGQARTLLTARLPVNDARPVAANTPLLLDAVTVPPFQTELERRTFPGAVREAIVAATALVKQEFGDFSNAAFPLGFLTFMAEAPTAFVTGFASALATDASNNRKRKRISDSTESDVASASTSASVSVSVSVSASATSTSADPLPPPRKKCHPPSVRARVPLAASTADALSPPRKTRNPPFMRARAPSPPSPHRYKQRKASQFTENLPVKPHIHYYPRRPLVATQPAQHSFFAAQRSSFRTFKAILPQHAHDPPPRTLLSSTVNGPIPAAPLLPSTTFLFTHRT